MSIAENLQELRKSRGLSQEELADIIGVSRQAIGKWENGSSIPEIDKLIQLSDYYKVSLDRMVREAQVCNIQLSKDSSMKTVELIQFLIRGKRVTYAGGGNEIASSRRKSHDLEYQEEGMYYYDTYLGGERFGGEEAIWKKEKPLWCMNYCGKVIGEPFNGKVLKNALLNVSEDSPYRGPVFYQEGDYSYHCKVDGNFEWFQGYEEILHKGSRIYECYFHGGIII